MKSKFQLASSACLVLLALASVSRQAQAQPEFNDWETACLLNTNFDLHWIEDLSSSYAPDSLTIAGPNIAPFVDGPLPSWWYNMRFGLSVYSDKPEAPFGYSSDICYEPALSLTTTGDAWTAAYFSLPRLSGRDWKESQMDAAFYSIVSNSLGWSNNGPVNGDGTFNARLNFLVTDAGFHTTGEAPGLVGGNDCYDTDYKNMEDIKAALEATDQVLVFFTTPDVDQLYQAAIDAGTPSGRVFVIDSTNDGVLPFIALIFSFIRCDILGFELTTTESPGRRLTESLHIDRENPLSKENIEKAKKIMERLEQAQGASVTSAKTLTRPAERVSLPFN